eukprot:14091052-Alexandrium_andersonii.AAC.1
MLQRTEDPLWQDAYTILEEKTQPADKERRSGRPPASAAVRAASCVAAEAGEPPGLPLAAAPAQKADSRLTRGQERPIPMVALVASACLG